MSIEIYKPESAPVIRGVLFDMDGLVLDTEKLYSRFWMEACHHFGFPMTYEQSLKMRALNRHLGEAMLKSFFGPDTDYIKLRTKRIELMDAFVEENGIALKPGIRELLRFAKDRGIRTAITSSSPMDRIRSHLGSHGLDTAFDALVSGKDVPRGKPEPDIYLRGAEVLGLKPEDCLALEVAPAGILSAHRAGCLPVMIPDLEGPGKDILPLLYARADSLNHIIGLIEAQNGHL
jgi:HAD superfamily hydrolase (TIGR01509 family)